MLDSTREGWCSGTDLAHGRWVIQASVSQVPSSFTNNKVTANLFAANLTRRWYNIYIYRIHFPCKHDPTSVDWSQTLTMRRGVSVCPNVSQWRGPKRFHCKLWKQDWKGHMVTQYQAVHAKISYFIVIHSNSKQLVVWHPNSTHAIHALEVDA